MDHVPNRRTGALDSSFQGCRDSNCPLHREGECTLPPDDEPSGIVVVLGAMLGFIGRKPHCRLSCGLLEFLA